MQNIQIARYELKYPVHPQQMPRLLQRLERYCKPDSNASGNTYTIHSLYFDSANFRSYHDAEKQLLQRFKIRVRSYDAPNAPVKLEVKRRDGDLVLKSSAMVDRNTWNRESPQGISAVLSSGDPRFAEFSRHVNMIHASPKMLVGYHRSAFSSTVDDYVRVTFDSTMRCQRVSTLDLIADPRKWRFLDDPISQGCEASSFMMELKFVHAAPRWLFDIVSEFGLRRQGYSKYGRAVRRYVYGRETAWDLRPASAVFGFKRHPANDILPESMLWRRA